jgi:hypothetical protein
MTHRFSSQRILAAAPLWVLAGMLFSAVSSRADDPPDKHRRMENRFLFVIDTSSAMKARRKGVEDSVRGLLESGMKGELRKGDTIGLWTFSDRLDTDFPMEVWSDDKKDGIEKEVVEHVLSLQYEKRSHLDKVMPVIRQVVESSERLTIILIYDGAELNKLTPFDKDINKLHKQYAGEFRSAHAPFVTILAAHFGAVFDYTINYPGTVMVPHTADPLPPPETNAPTPLVVSVPPEEPAPPHIQIVLSGSDFPHNSSTPSPAVDNAAAVVTPAPAPAPLVITSSPPPAAVTPIAAQAATTNAAAPPPVASPPSSSIVTTPAKPVPTEPAPSPVPAVAAPVTPAGTAPVAAEAAAIPAMQQAALFVTALSLLTIAVVLVLLLVRRSRGGPQQSLISQSIDRSR